jgi:hypothetical protein
MYGIWWAVTEQAVRARECPPRLVREGSTRASRRRDIAQDPRAAENRIPASGARNGAVDLS